MTSDRQKRRRAKPRLTRSEIVAAAVRVLERRGHAELTIRNVASELGVKSASLYWHFETKEELEDELADALLADLKPSQAVSVEWRQELRDSAIRFYRHLKSKRDVSLLL